jgi:rhodanese-related sulfurtransferase
MPLYHKAILLLSLFSTNSTIGASCLSKIEPQEEGCNIINILENSPEVFQIREEKLVSSSHKINITETIKSIQVQHEQQTITIRRDSTNNEKTCPPFCIQPMNIGKVKTVGELEVLEFIKDLKKKKLKLFIDSRLPQAYKESTIPGAINIPYTMLEESSKYKNRIIKLLGGKRRGEQWKFTNVPILLMFGESEESSHIVQAIKSLLALSYPSRKILYYRGGIENWKRLGLTIY